MLTSSMHRRGINMRYLGKLFKVLEPIQSESLVIFKRVILEEMILRAIKHILRNLLENLAKPFIGICIAHFLNCFFSTREQTINAIGNESFAKMTPGSLKDSINLQINQRFRYDCGKLDETFVQIHGYAFLKGICKKIGIQINARTYSFVKPDFISTDILNLYPIVKSIEYKVKFYKKNKQNLYIVGIW